MTSSRIRGWLLVSLSTLAAVAVAALPQAPAQETPGDEDRIRAIDRRQVEPWRPPRVARVDGDAPPSAREGISVPPEGVPVSQERLEAIRRRAVRLAPPGRGVAPPLPAIVAGPVPGAPKTRSKFNGIHIRQAGGFTPPDTQIAAGPEHLFEAVNVAVELTNKRGRQVRRETANEHFGVDDDAFLFDPKTHFDPLSERFFLVFMEVDFGRRKSFIHLSVSRGPTPETLGPDDWCNYRIKSKRGASWADYPGLGMNATLVAISANNFRFRNDSFRRSFIHVIQKADLVDNADRCRNLDVSLIRTRRDPEGRQVFNPQVAQHYGADDAAGGDLLAVNAPFLSFSDELVLWRIDNDGRRPSATREVVSLPDGYSFPPEASQRGSTKPLDSGDVRIMQQLPFVDDQLWVVNTSGCALGDDVVSCVHVARIRVGAGSATVDLEDTFGVRDHFLYWPGIGVAANGDVVAAFHMSGKRMRLGTAFNGLRSGAARFGALSRMPDEFDGIRRLVKGKCPTELPTTRPVVRTGDYIGVARDPVSDEIWIAGEFARRVRGSCGWVTKVASVSY